jgi:N-acyl-D-amino-acid deacylase
VWIGVIALYAGAVLLLWRTWLGPFDIIICNGQVFDGERFLPVGTCVGIKDGSIKRIGFLYGAQTISWINAWKRVVSPGFIDVHTHVERNIIRNSPFRAPNFIRQGVTTLITGNCGTSTVDVEGMFAGLRRYGSQINVATLIGHNSIREEVMGSSKREASFDELQQMCQIVDRNMRAGAIGLSTGLEYSPGCFASEEEVVKLAMFAARHGGMYVTHLRNEGMDVKRSLEEALKIGERAFIPVHISHFKIAARTLWGTSGDLLKRIRLQRANGFSVSMDVYGYTSSSTSTDLLLPPHFRGNRVNWKELNRNASSREELIKAMVAQLQRDGFSDYSHARVAHFQKDPSLNGQRIDQVAKLIRHQLPDWKVKATTLGQKGIALAPPSSVFPPPDQIKTVLWIVSRGGAQMIYTNMSEQDVSSIMKDPETCFGSDSAVRNEGLTSSHPRGLGNIPRILSHFVRDLRVLSLKEALRKMTSFAADTFGLDSRGRLQEGRPADIVVFDPKRIQDEATYDQPLRPAAGIDYVFVNGRLTMDHGVLTKEYAGQPIRYSRLR